jgi:hypothetical protein
MRSGRACFVILGYVYALRGYAVTNGLLTPPAGGQRIRLRRPRSQASRPSPFMATADRRGHSHLAHFATRAGEKCGLDTER